MRKRPPRNTGKYLSRRRQILREEPANQSDVTPQNTGSG